MSVIVLSIQLIQEMFQNSKLSRLIIILKFFVLSYLFFLIYQEPSLEKYKFVSLAVFFIWFTFWEIKKNKSSLYPGIIYLALLAVIEREQISLLAAIMTMSIYIYTKLTLKNKYGVSNLISLVIILASCLLLLSNPQENLTVVIIMMLLFSINFLYNPFINSYSHKTELLLIVLMVFLYMVMIPEALLSKLQPVLIAAILFSGTIFLLERKNLKIACISQLSVHLLLMTRASPLIFLYSLLIVFITWSIFEYISRDNNDFLSKIIILIFASDLPFTPYFVAKYKAFSVLYTEKQWVLLALIILYSLIITGTIISYLYKSILTFAKNEKQIQETPVVIYVQRVSIALFFLLYTLLPLILFKQ